MHTFDSTRVNQNLANSRLTMNQLCSSMNILVQWYNVKSITNISGQCYL